MKPVKYICSRCGTVYLENYEVLHYQKTKNEDLYYMVCPIDKAIAYKEETVVGELAIVGSAIVGQAKVGKIE